jgi:hypothetical protein
MRHVLDGIEVRVVSRNFETTAPSTAAVKIHTAGVWDSGTINHELVVVETFILGSRDADPSPVLALGQGVLCASQEFEHDALCLWRNHTGADAPFRIDLGVLFAGLVKRRRLEIFHGRFARLGYAKLAQQSGGKRKN